MVEAYVVGQLIGQKLQEATSYKDSFVETDDPTNLNLVAVSKAPVVCTVYCYKQMVGSHFVLDHPVNGNLDSSLFALDTGLGAKSLYSSTII